MARGNNQGLSSVRSEFGSRVLSPKQLNDEISKMSNLATSYFKDLSQSRQIQLTRELKDYKVPELSPTLNSIKTNIIQLNAKGTLNDENSIYRFSLVSRTSKELEPDVYGKANGVDAYFKFINDKATAVAHTLVTEGVAINKDTLERALKDTYDTTLNMGFKPANARQTMYLVFEQASNIMSKYLPKKNNPED